MPTREVFVVRLQPARAKIDRDRFATSDAVAQQWAELVARLRRKGRRVPLNDTWIAATALSGRLPVVTQDADYDAIEGLQVIRV